MVASAWILIFSLMLLHQVSALLLEQDCCVAQGAGQRHSPWIAVVITKGKTCTGSLINNRHVLTAASCVDNKDRALVRLGVDDQTEQYNVKCSVIHHLYNSTTYVNDIALLKLQRKVEFKPHIRPICLSSHDNTIAWAKNVRIYTAIFVGLNEEKQFKIQRFNPNHCHDTFQYPLRESQICAAFRDNTSCVEIGSPLVKKKKVNGIRRWSLFGINSYGRSETCVYTNVMSYIDWIVENVLLITVEIPEGFKNKRKHN